MSTSAITTQSQAVSNPVPTPGAPLSAEQLDDFSTDGFVLIKHVLTRAEIDAAVRHILAMFPRDLVIPEKWYSRSGRIKPFHNGYGKEERIGHEDNGIYDDPELLPLLCNDTLYRCAAQLLGTPELRVQDGTIGYTIRTDDGPELTQTVHVDATVPPEASHFLLTPEEVAVGGCYYLTDVEPNGGGIHVVPGGHRLVAEKSTASANGRQLYKRWRDVTDFPPTVEVTGEAGDFVMTHHLLPHAAAANRRPQPRLTYFVRFIRLDNPHYTSKPADSDRFNSRQLRAMTPLARKLLGVETW